MGLPLKSDAVSQAWHLPAPINQERNISPVGVHLFSYYMEMEEEFSIILEQQKLAIEFHVGENQTFSFPLLSHGEDTLMRRFKALFLRSCFMLASLSNAKLNPFKFIGRFLHS